MTRKNLLEHLSYHYWATDKLLTACGALSEDDLHKDRDGSFGTLFATLVHMYSAEDIWLARWQNREDPGFSPAEDFTDIKHIRREWYGQRQRIEAFLDTADTDASMNVKGYAFTLWQMLLHVIDHSSFHRGQVVHMLRNAGQVPPHTNFIHYLREQQDMNKNT